MPRMYGKYRAEVVDRDDPRLEGRLLVAPSAWRSGDGETLWATACVPAGSTVLPEVGTTVWIEVEAGDISRPLWTGCA